MQKFSKASKASVFFSDDELLDLVGRYPYINHLREALGLKRDDMRVYVATPYDTALSRGYELAGVLELARRGADKARSFFVSKFEIYSPVLDMGGLKISRGEAMARCFLKLKNSHFLFIPNLPYVLDSDGIRQEYRYAKKRKIIAIFETKELRGEFLKRIGDER